MLSVVLIQYATPEAFLLSSWTECVGRYSGVDSTFKRKQTNKTKKNLPSCKGCGNKILKHWFSSWCHGGHTGQNKFDFIAVDLFDCLEPRPRSWLKWAMLSLIKGQYNVLWSRSEMHALFNCILMLKQLSSGVIRMNCVTLGWRYGTISCMGYLKPTCWVYSCTDSFYTLRLGWVGHYCFCSFNQTSLQMFSGPCRCTHHCQRVFKKPERAAIAPPLTEPCADNLSAWKAFYCHSLPRGRTSPIFSTLCTNWG